MLLAISDGIYGSVFYLTTGLHGFHVIRYYFYCCLFYDILNFITVEHHLG